MTTMTIVMKATTTDEEEEFSKLGVQGVKHAQLLGVFGAAFGLIRH